MGTKNLKETLLYRSTRGLIFGKGSPFKILLAMASIEL
jgi:hypothetical protein